jgi:hypothetical protein
MSNDNAIALAERNTALPIDAERARRIALLTGDVATLRRAVNPAMGPYLLRAVTRIIDAKLAELRALDNAARSVS